MTELSELPYGAALTPFAGAQGIVVVDHDGGEEAVVAQFFDNFLDGQNRIHKFVALLTHAEKMGALLRSAVASWPQFETDESVSGTEMVQWFGEFWQSARDLLHAVDTASAVSSTDKGIQSMQVRAELDATASLPMQDANRCSGNQQDHAPASSVTPTTVSAARAPSNDILIELTYGGIRSQVVARIEEDMVMQGRSMHPGVVIDGLDPHLNEVIAYAVNEGGELAYKWESDDDRPEFSFRVINATSEQLARIQRLEAIPPAGVTIATTDGHRFTVQDGGTITDDSMTYSSMADLQVDFEINVQRETIGMLMKTLAHFANAVADPEILALPVSSGCGADCAKALVAGNHLAQLCADERDRIVRAVLDQVRVFYFG